MRSPKTKLLLRVGLALGFCAAAAYGRTFTNTEGKTIEAEIVRATTTTVTLRLGNDLTSTVDLDKLSQVDRDFVKAWLADRIPRLRFTPNMVRSRKDPRYGGSSSSRSSYRTQNYKLTVEVNNEETSKGLADSVMKFILVGRSLTDSNRHKILAVQNVDFRLEPGGRTTIPFREVVNKYYDSRYSRAKSGYKGIGYVLYAERKRDQRMVYSHASTRPLEEYVTAIAQLESGDMTDEFFQKAAPMIGEDGEAPPDPDDPIIVR